MLRIVALFLLISTQTTISEKYRIFLKDKGNNDFRVGSELYEKTIRSLSYRSLERRKKVLPPDSIVTFEDAPVFGEYIQEIQKLDISVVLQLKWLNYVVVEVDSIKLGLVSDLPFVKKVQPVGSKVSDVLINSARNTTKTNQLESILFTQSEDEDTLYGVSRRQLEMLGITRFQSMGILGDSVLVGVLDTGFRWKTHQSLIGTNVIGEYDFLFLDTITSNEQQDVPSQDIHGTMVLSIIAGFSIGHLIGTSPLSMFILGKTEDLRRETRFEEDCFASAIEWMDSAGVDIISSSLGYFNFDSTNVNYLYEDLDGRTALTSIYANKAFERGIVMVTAVGNRGPDPSTLHAPADAFGEISVGAVDVTGDTVLKFSSRGPTFDGRIKPDFCAMGVGVVSALAAQPDSFLVATGTSVATPLISGGIATLISTFEELTPVEVKTLLVQHSNRSKEPDNNFGYGIPDFYSAALDYDIVISPPITFRIFDRQRIIFNVVYKKPINGVKLFIRGISSPFFTEHLLDAIDGPNHYFFDILFQNEIDSVFEFYVEVVAEDGHQRRKPFFPNKFYRIKIGDESKNLPIVQKFTITDITESKNNDLVNIRVFPEIISSSLPLSINFNVGEIGMYILKVYNFAGIELLTERYEITFPSSQWKQINSDNLANGLYFVRIISPIGKMYIKSFLKL